MDECYAIMRESPKVLISSYELVFPPTLANKEKSRYFIISEKILKKENVGTILNVANDLKYKKNPIHDEMYHNLDIQYKFLGIDDTLSDPLPANFLEDVLDIYQNHLEKYGQDKAFLVNCMSGINRSALAIAGILWKTTLPKKWSTPLEMIEEMRENQIRDRKMCWLLNNDNFVNYLIEWCQKN